MLFHRGWRCQIRKRGGGKGGREGGRNGGGGSGVILGGRVGVVCLCIYLATGHLGVPDYCCAWGVTSYHHPVSAKSHNEEMQHRRGIKKMVADLSVRGDLGGYGRVVCVCVCMCVLFLSASVFVCVCICE